MNNEFFYKYDPEIIGSREKWAGKAQGRYLKKFENTAIAASGTWQLLKETDEDAVNFGPFDAVHILNLSNYDITIVYDNNTNRADVVPGKTIFTRGDASAKDAVLFRNLKIVNRSAAFEIPAATVIITVEKRGVL